LSISDVVQIGSSSRRRKGLSDVRTQSLVSSPTRATRLNTQLRAG
jgi:hypothetical protein